jgi:hypothetical protein
LSEHFVLMQAFGFALFSVGVLTRTYMNIKIGQAPADGATTRSTEIKYMRLVRNKGAPIWPLIITIVFIPLGIIVCFAAIILSNHPGAK